MSIEELKKKFFVDEDVLAARLESVLQKATAHCAIDKAGIVHISNQALGNKDRVKIVLVARAIASQLEPAISAEVSLQDLEKSTGIDPKQLAARAGELVKEKFATSPQRGSYRAVNHKIEGFLDSLSK